MYDTIIIGAGPAGISASLYTKRANLQTLIISKNNSSLKTAKDIQNYYGFEDGINGEQLYKTGIKQAQNLGVEIKEEEVISIENLEEKFIIKTNKENIETKTIILATGNKKNKPKIKGIKEFEGKGISYCAICDGFFYRNKNVAVIGNGNYAINETMELMGIAKNVTILTNGKEEPEFRAENVKTNSKQIKEITGETQVSKITFEDDSNLQIDAVFIAEGVAGSTEFARKIGAITKEEKIIVNENMETNIQGLYACGDCVGGLFQISKAVHEGTKAAMQVIQYVRKQ